MNNIFQQGFVDEIEKEAAKLKAAFSTAKNLLSRAGKATKSAYKSSHKGIASEFDNSAYDRAMHKILAGAITPFELGARSIGKTL